MFLRRNVWRRLGQFLALRDYDVVWVERGFLPGGALGPEDPPPRNDV